MSIDHLTSFKKITAVKVSASNQGFIINHIAYFLPLAKITYKYSMACITLTILFLAAILATVANNSLASNPLTYIGLFFIAFIIGCRYFYLRSTDPFLLLFLFFSLLFIEFPIALMAIFPNDFDVGYGLHEVIAQPNSEQVGFAVILLLLCYLCIFFITSLYPIRQNTVRGSFSLLRGSILGLTLLLFSFFFDENLGLSAPNTQFFVLEVIKTISNDWAITTFLITVIILNNKIYKNNSINLYFFVFFIVFFLLYQSLQGSKGAMLTTLVCGIIFPFAISAQFTNSIVPIFRTWILILFGLLSIPLFVIGLELRFTRKYMGEDYSLINLLNSNDLGSKMFEYNTDYYSNWLATFWIICQRLSVEFYRYVLIVTKTNPIISFDNQASLNYFYYCGKNLINLLIPGTVYSEAYQPSSMMLEPLLLGRDMISVDPSEYWQRLNTQPTTIFGLSWITFGFFAPVLVSFIYIFLRWIFNQGKMVMQAWSIFFFWLILCCYGIESAIQLSIGFALTFWILYGFTHRPPQISSSISLNKIPGLPSD